MSIKSENLNSVELVIFDFDGVFTDNRVYISSQGIESVKCWRSDGLGLSRLKSLNIPIYIVSSEKNPVVSVRAEKLAIPVMQAIDDKSEAVEKICSDLNVSLENTMFVGNDINDIPALKIVGFPVGVADIYSEAESYIHLKTAAKGGQGAVREICDCIYKSKINSDTRDD